MNSPGRRRSRELCLLVSLLFLLLFNYPLVLPFNRTTPVLGIPLGIFYLLGGWLLFIGIIFLISRNLGGRERGKRPGTEGRREGS
jgi:hypothetical protein